MEFESGFVIAGREVFPLEGRIGSSKGKLRVEPKAMAVLIELARHAPQVRTRKQIEQAVWPRGYVSNDVLTRCIGQLRRSLGDNPKAPSLLETIPRRGYRLCAQPQPMVRAPSDTAMPSASAVETLLVLPFRHLAAQREGFVAEGLTELLILRLCGLRGMRILSRTTAMQFASTTASIGDIAARTGADWVVEGSVLQAGDRVQVIAQLIDARTDAHIWAADYSRGLEDLLAMQNEIAERVAMAIRAQLGAAEVPTPAAPALASAGVRDYLRGRHLLSRRTVPALREAIQAFAAVTQGAPDYAPAWASRAECEMLLMHYGAAPAAELLAPCEAHLEHALALDPQLGIGLSTRGAMRFFFALDFEGAARDLQQALHLLPSYGLAMVQLASVALVRHQFDEARAWIEQALLVDPLDVGVNMNFGDHMILQRRYGDAAVALQRALELAPSHRPSRLRLAWALALAGQADAAARALAACGPENDADATWLEYAALVAAAQGATARAAAYDDALRCIAAQQRVSPWTLARSAAAAGRLAAALDELAVAGRERSSSWPFLRLTPAFDALHGDARFEALAASLPGAP
ncbi:winged helix-turn-helix domain-containing protein [Paucibacter soli]|uniref:winged helix-turn-helix domain-containing protein n=1 Tax=Paucibacter soli TaxID=3133433 RepID=UPI0030B08496